MSRGVNYFRSLFDYDPGTGVITNKIDRHYKALAGTPAGAPQNKGYLRVMVKRKSYLAHRLILFMVNGEWPEQVDHINHVRDDNRLSNLREVTSSDNHKNTVIHKHNTSGVMGVYWLKKNKKWGARIQIDYQVIWIGSYTDWFDAVCARKDAGNIFNFHTNHGAIT